MRRARSQTPALATLAVLAAMTWRSVEFRGRWLYYRDAYELGALKLQILLRELA